MARRMVRYLWCCLLVVILFWVTNANATPSSASSHGRKHVFQEGLPWAVSIETDNTPFIPRRHLRSTNTPAAPQHRRLPGEFDFDFDFNDLDSSEIAILVVGLFLLVCLIPLLLLCCCCGRCSLCDILALVCLWELCCDPSNGNMIGDSFVLL